MLADCEARGIVIKLFTIECRHVRCEARMPIVISVFSYSKPAGLLLKFMFHNRIRPL